MLVNQTFFDRLTNIFLRGVVSKLSIYVVANLTLGITMTFCSLIILPPCFLDNCFLVVYVNMAHC